MSALILTYHRVHPGHRIDPETFDAQLCALARRFAPVTLDEAVGFARGTAALARGGFAVTFDDGWTDVLRFAFPILERRGIPATVFVSTKQVADGPVARTDRFDARSVRDSVVELATAGRSDQFLTWDELRRMQPLVRVESHGHTHAAHVRGPKVTGVAGPELTERQAYLLFSGERPASGKPLREFGSVLAYPRYDERGGSHETADDFRRRVTGELAASRDIIAAKTGRAPRHIAWPFGEYGAESVAAAKAAGFESCLTTRQGGVARGDDPYALARFSPPRSRRWFALATGGRAGMAAYRFAVAAADILRGASR